MRLSVKGRSLVVPPFRIDWKSCVYLTVVYVTNQPVFLCPSLFLLPGGNGPSLPPRPRPLSPLPCLFVVFLIIVVVVLVVVVIEVCGCLCCCCCWYQGDVVVGFPTDRFYVLSYWLYVKLYLVETLRTMQERSIAAR